ncbi:MAG TPA: hypothetical protein VL624_01755 [Caldimonas sp.]|nr:hypothetical protein [Caldimonas sp.]
MKTHRLRAAAACVAVSAAFVAAPASAQSASEIELARRLDQLAAELASVKAELAKLQRERASPATAASAPDAGAPTAAPAPALAAAPVVASDSQAQGSGIALGPSTVLTSYGEIHYNRPTHDSSKAVADLTRFVLGLQHRFDEKTKLVTELEVEHAVSSSDDPGEVEVEQAYIERQLGRQWALRAGLFLIPAGVLNENHEPTAFYGVERNFVETAIIPSTWREGGLQVVGNFDNGVTTQLGVTTGFDLTKWDAMSTEGRDSPLGAIHQELALAKARDLSVFGALNWRGVPGLLVGGSVFTGGATHGQAATSSRVTLWDVHTRYTPGRWDLSALYSRGTISNTAAFNTPLVGSTSLVPASFDGWYAQAAYRLWSRGDLSLAPFIRWEEFNTARSFASLGTGLTPDAAPTERVVTIGANFNVGPGIVFKADYQRFRVNGDADRFNLGMGWSF